MPMKSCEHCEVEFLAMRENVTVCADCRTITCKNCGKQKLVQLNQLGSARFCSRECRVKWNASHIEDRFWSWVDFADDCWLWTGGKSHGYGLFHPAKGESIRAHRFAYELTHGSITDELFCLHRCDNPPCVRPDHLFLGTHEENVADMMSKGRGRSYSAIGEEHHLHKVMEDEVRQIRVMYKPGVISAKKVGEMFGIHEDTVRQIASRKTWKHVQ